MRYFFFQRRAAAMCTALIVYVITLFPGGVGAATAPVIVYPPDRALLSGVGPMNLLGFLPGRSPGSLTITGKSGARSQPVGPGLFSFKTTLDPGENALVLLDRTVSVFVSEGASATIPAGYAPADTHAVDNGCEDCHAFSSGAAALLEKPPALCANCHDDVLKDNAGKPQAVLHPPAEEGDCLACHPFHQLSIKQLPAAAKRELCFGCHDDFTTGGKKRMHAPVAEGRCTGCHGPHGASEKKLLLATGTGLCLLCHANPELGTSGQAWAVPHPALDDGCGSCHLPHVADAPRLLIKPVRELCADCHDPFPTEEAGVELVQHNPVEEGECAACHAVHGSDQKSLLAAPGKALCVQCHEDPSLAPDGEEWAAAHPALDDGCFVCHLPHVAPAAGMLKSRQAALCFECHDAFALPGADIGSLHQPVIQGKCSSCHAPHGSAEEKLLLAPPGRELCVKCHKDPGLDPGGADWAVPHPALDDGCPTCHLPHISANPRLLAEPQPQLCAGCHEDKNLNSDGVAWSVPHLPVAKGMCGSCHDVHGGPQQALLKKLGNQTCGICHEEVHERHQVVDLDPSTGQPTSGMVQLPPGFPVEKSNGSLGCVGCHLPHGADNQRLWTGADVESFCIRCHPM